MNGADLFDDDRTFRVIFAGDGVGKLKENVKEKLIKLMGDYCDDTLVDYVVVLLRNGRHKDEVTKDLNVFLGDDTIPFVSWLWDYLSSNYHLHVERKVQFHDHPSQVRSLKDKSFGRYDAQPHQMSGRKHNDLEFEKQELSRLSRNRHNREWRGLVQGDMQPFFLHDILNEKHLEKNHQKTDLVGRPHSPMRQAHKKRHWKVEQKPTKGDRYSDQLVGPPSRLLQFALRDAMMNVQNTSSSTEPAPKRLCSMVSTPSTDNFLADKSQVTRVIYTGEEAGEDVQKVRCSGNVFCSQGDDMDTIETINQPSIFKDDMLEEEEFDDIFQIPGLDDLGCYEGSKYDGEPTEDNSMSHAETGTLNNEGYGCTGSRRFMSDSAFIENKNPFKLKDNVSKDSNGGKQTRIGDQEPHATAAGKEPRKIVNISVNVNTWKPSQLQRSWNLSGGDSLSNRGKGNLRTGMSNVPHGNTAIFETHDAAVVVADVEKEFQKTVPSTPGSYGASHPCDEADSRIIFVSNVHFAATKDALSHHFKKFGDVLKVIILTDTTTGQPKGSAFIEFFQKESAEQALSLNGTYFMSRVLKVIRKAAACHQGAPLMVGPRITRGSLLAPMLRRRAAFPRGGIMPSFVRPPLLPIKLGAHSLQWKRGASTAQSADGVKSLQNASLPPRSFTYIRTC